MFIKEVSLTMVELFRRKLSKSSVKTRIVYINKKNTEKLPQGQFKIIMGGQEYTKRVDKYNRIVLAVKEFADEGDFIIFSSE